MVGSIAGFQVTNVIEVLTSKLELAGELIETAVEAGANRIDSIGFALSDPGPHRDEAIRLAARRALHEGEVLAEAAGMRIVRIISIKLDHGDRRAAVRGGGGASRMSGGGSVGEGTMVVNEPGEIGVDERPKVSGEVTVSAEVDILFEIAPRK